MTVQYIYDMYVRMMYVCMMYFVCMDGVFMYEGIYELSHVILISQTRGRIGG